MATRGDAIHDLAGALHELRAAVEECGYPLALPSAGPARSEATAVLEQIDDYALPRVADLDAPLLVVVGGSTGAGKSTLVNSLVRAPVSAAGVLRPTTRAPVLICHPADIAWFRQGAAATAAPFGGLSRTSRPTSDPHQLQLVAAPALSAGLALMDTPDIDSVVDANREVGGQLFAAADLLLFVTTAARYADALPWDLLHAARERGSMIALVLDRVPADATAEVITHLSAMLVEHGFAPPPADLARHSSRSSGHDAARPVPLFVLPETRVDGQGLLPEAVPRPLRRWFDELVADERARARMVRSTLDGALAALASRVETLAVAADEQVAAAEVLAERVGLAYGLARSTVERGLRDGSLLRGEVLPQWQEFLGSGGWRRAMRARAGSWRDRVCAAVKDRRVGAELVVALRSALATRVRSAATDAAAATHDAWCARAGGAEVVTEPGWAWRGELAGPSPGLTEQIERMVQDWQRRVLELVRVEIAERRTAPPVAYAINATAVLTTVGAVAPTAPFGTAAPPAAARGPVPGAAAGDRRGSRTLTGVAAGERSRTAEQTALAAIMEDGTIRTLARMARDDLLDRIGVLLDAEAARYLDRLAGVSLDGAVMRRLREAGNGMESARAAANLVPATAEADPAADAEADPAAAAEPAADAEADPVAAAEVDPVLEADR